MESVVKKVSSDAAFAETVKLISCEGFEFIIDRKCAVKLIKCSIVSQTLRY